MVLLPDPSKFNANPPQKASEKKYIFFENPDLDQMARHFIGNNYRYGFFYETHMDEYIFRATGSC